MASCRSASLLYETAPLFSSDLTNCSESHHFEPVSLGLNVRYHSLGSVHIAKTRIMYLDI
jgi:hypothetical protein